MREAIHTAIATVINSVRNDADMLMMMMMMMMMTMVVMMMMMMMVRRNTHCGAHQYSKGGATCLEVSGFCWEERISFGFERGR